MKILHTSDWHLGHTLYGYDRTEEQQQMLDQMVSIVQTEQPDVFLLCGDVYHTGQPSAFVQTMFNNAIFALHAACESMTIVVTAGNHDSATKHEIFRAPWTGFDVHMIGLLKSEVEDCIVEIPGKGYVIAVPYVHERFLQDGLFQQLLDLVAARNEANLPVVLSAHTTIVGADFTGHEMSDEATIGGIDAVKVSDIGEGYDYLALGHIHKPQFVHTGRHNVRYSGTPIPISFDENYEHSVSIVEIDAHGAQPSVRTIVISNPHPLTTLPTEGFASWDDVKEQLCAFPDDYPNYIRLNVLVSSALPVGIQHEASLLVAGKQCRFCYINAMRETDEAAKTTRQLSVQEFQAKSPLDVVKMYAADSGELFDETMEELFNEALSALQEEQRES